MTYYLKIFFLLIATTSKIPTYHWNHFLCLQKIPNEIYLKGLE